MNLLREFYVQPMHMVYIEFAAMYVIWIAAMLLIKGKAKRIVSAAACALSLAMIVLFTLIRQSDGGELILTPFISFTYAKTEPEFYRTMFMNMFLFVPFGMSLAFALPEKIKHRVILTVLIGITLSVFVEASQFVFKLGRCETDDVIMNTLGAFIGASTLLICNAIQRLIKRKKYDRNP